MSISKLAQQPEDYLTKTGDRLKESHEGFHPIKFAEQFDDLIKRMDKLIQYQHAPREPSFRVFSMTLAPNTYQTIVEHPKPDKWIVLTDDNTGTKVGVFPGAGQPYTPNMFTVANSDSATIPAVNEYLSVKNIGPASTTVSIVALTGYDFDYTPPTNRGNINVSSGTEFFPIVPSDTIPITPRPRAIYIGVSGDVIMRGENDVADVTFTAMNSGVIYDLSPSYIRATNTTATGIIGII